MFYIDNTMPARYATEESDALTTPHTSNEIVAQSDKPSRDMHTLRIPEALACLRIELYY
jgi:hypothetical protein